MKILVAMSGGVDSSVAARLLTGEGNACVGCTMRLYCNEDAGLPERRTCCSLEDVSDARSVAFQLGMPYYVFNFTDGFREKVMQPFAEAYCRGETPNPCIDCNRFMKFEKLFERARVLGCGCVATGHYARILQQDGRYLLKKAADPDKDQSYVLYAMNQQQLAHTLFPLGELHKSQVRRIAEENGFVNARKPDSQDICFVPDGDYAAFVQRQTGFSPEPGLFVSPEGEPLGYHRGIIHYTVGQRRGLGVSLGERRYVCRICPEDNTVVLGSARDLLCRELTAKDFNWISGETPGGPVRCRVRTRYRQPEQWAEAEPMGPDRVRIRFDEPQKAAAPGQAAVLYDGDTVLGGGVIVRDPA